MCALRGALLAAVSLLLSADAIAGQATQTELAAALLTGDPAERFAAVQAVEAIPPQEVKEELRSALIEAVELANAERRERVNAIMAGQGAPEHADEGGNLDFYIIRALAGLRDSAAIPALAGALGTGMMVIRALVEFGEPAVPATLNVVRSPEADVSTVRGGLIALRFFVEREGLEGLQPRLSELRAVAAQRLSGDQRSTTLRRAIDLAVVLGDRDLVRIVEELASDPEAVIARGITEQRLIDQVMDHAAERLASPTAVPRPPDQR